MRKDNLNQPIEWPSGTKAVIVNGQNRIARGASLSAIFFFVLMWVASAEIDGLEIHPAIFLLSIFLGITSVVVAFLFWDRGEKLDMLTQGQSCIARWVLMPSQKEKYVSHLYEKEVQKNKSIFTLIAIIGALVFGVFILMIEEGKLAMFLVYLGLMILLAIFAFGMPRYYRYKNEKGDGQVLLGKHYAYVNGYFHNWDFPLSGLNRVNPIGSPFTGIYLSYYYTDRTAKHVHEMVIPIPKEIDAEEIVRQLNEA